MIRGGLRIDEDFIWWGDKRYYLCIMRLNNTKYELIDNLPANAAPVSLYAKENNTAVGYIYIKYERFLKGEGKQPSYIIRCFKGSNYVIPQ